MAVIVEKREADEALQILNKHTKAKIVGKIKEGKGVEVAKLGIKIM